MSKKQRDLTADEKKLWRRVASGVKRRRPHPLEPDGPEQRGTTKQRVTEATPADAASVTRSKSPPAPPQDRRNEKRVRRGKLEIGGTLDLHGHTQDAARAALKHFVRLAQRRGDRTIIVITGVGRAGEGVLKKRLPEWLSGREVAAFVSGYATAHRSHGGPGAFYVFIKRGR